MKQKSLVALVCIFTFLFTQVASAFEGPNKNEAVIVAFKQTVSQFSQAHTLTQMQALVRPSLSAEDMDWLNEQKEFAEVPSSSKVSIKGDSLIVTTKGADEIRISVVNQKRLIFKVNGAVWQYHPYLPLQQNVENLKKILEGNSKTTFFNSIFHLAIPEAQAGFFAIIGVAVVLIVAATALCAALVSGSDALACLMIPALPFLALKKLSGLYGDIKKAVSHIGDKALVVTDLNCKVDKKGKFLNAELIFQNGLLQITKGKGENKLHLVVNPSSIEEAPYTLDATYAENWATYSTTSISGKLAKSYNTSLDNNLNQVESLVDLCENKDRLKQFKETLSQTSKAENSPLNVNDSGNGKVPPSESTIPADNLGHAAGK